MRIDKGRPWDILSGWLWKMVRRTDAAGDAINPVAFFKANNFIIA